MESPDYHHSKKSSSMALEIAIWIIVIICVMNAFSSSLASAYNILL